MLHPSLSQAYLGPTLIHLSAVLQSREAFEEVVLSILRPAVLGRRLDIVVLYGMSEIEQ